jgi:hypothetical protein
MPPQLLTGYTYSPWMVAILRRCRVFAGERRQRGAQEAGGDNPGVSLLHRVLPRLSRKLHENVEMGECGGLKAREPTDQSLSGLP